VSEHMQQVDLLCFDHYLLQGFSVRHFLKHNKTPFARNSAIFTVDVLVAVVANSLIS